MRRPISAARSLIAASGDGLANCVFQPLGRELLARNGRRAGAEMWTRRAQKG